MKVGVGWGGGGVGWGCGVGGSRKRLEMGVCDAGSRGVGATCLSSNRNNWMG